MPEFGVIIPALAMNDNLYVDFHAMAQSPVDGTPPTAHMVLTEENVNDLQDYLSVGNMHLEWFQPNDFVTTEVDNVEMPETPTLKRSWVVDCLVVKQIAKVKDVSVNNGRVYIPPQELAKYRFMSPMKVRKAADAVMITGEYCLEAKTSKMPFYTRQKLLCLRFQKLLTSSISNDTVESMYRNLLPVSGRKSVDITKVVRVTKTCYMFFILTMLSYHTGLVHVSLSHETSIMLWCTGNAIPRTEILPLQLHHMLLLSLEVHLVYMVMQWTTIYPPQKRLFPKKGFFSSRPDPRTCHLAHHVVAQRTTVVRVFCSPDFAELLPRPYSTI